MHGIGEDDDEDDDDILFEEFLVFILSEIIFFVEYVLSVLMESVMNVVFEVE